MGRPAGGVGRVRELRAQQSSSTRPLTAGLQGPAVFFLRERGSGSERMQPVVMKFGGSSVVDAAAIGRVISIVDGERGRGRTPLLVVSAMGGMTDTLLSLANAARGGNAG